MANIMKSKTERGKDIQTKSHATRTTAQILEDQAAQAERDNAARGNASAKPAPTNGDTLYADDIATNEMLTRAAQFGELIDQDEGFRRDAVEIAKAWEVVDKQVITFLKHLDGALSSSQRYLLPWPGRTKAEAMAKLPAGSNQPILFDKVKGSAGRSKNETFYGNMVKHTKLGAAAVVELENLHREYTVSENETDKSKCRSLTLIKVDIARAGKRIKNLTSALRQAAKVRLLMTDIAERCPDVVVKWIRTPNDDVSIPEDADLSLLNVPEAGEVVPSNSCLLVYTVPVNKAHLDQAIRDAKQITIGSFVRWNVDRAIELALKDNNRKRIVLSDLEQSAKAATPTQTTQAPPASSVNDAEQDKRFAQRDVVDVKRAIDGALNWYQGATPLDQQTHNLEIVKALHTSDEFAASFYQWYMIVRPIFETDAKLVEKASAFLKASRKVEAA
jgi:hypothetical protein